METIHQQIVHFVTDGGKVPYQEWILQLSDRRADEIIHARIDRLRLGNFGDCKSLGSGLYELRIHYSKGYRIYFGRHGRTIVVLLCGGDKRMQPWDIVRAKHYWMNFQKRIK